MLIDLVPHASVSHPDVEQEHPTGTDDAPELANGMTPRGDQVQHVADEGGSEGAVGEREPCRVPENDRERRATARLLDELADHPRG